MKLIKQYSVLYGQTPTDLVEMTRWIEMAGRTCYRSEDKITKDSSVGFVQRMIKSGHGSVLEHSNIVLKNNVVSSVLVLGVLKERMAFHQVEVVDGYTYINGNLRAWIDTIAFLESLGDDISMSALHFIDSFYTKMNFLLDKKVGGAGSWDLVTDPAEIPMNLRKYTMRVVTNRAMTHEIVRHRIGMSYSQESQRYVSYKDGVEFVIPVWATDIANPSVIIGVNKIEKEQTAAWLATMEAIEKVYASLVISGMKPQQAREVLPNSTKTEIVITGGHNAWEWFFHLRDSSACDPQMSALAKMMRTQFVNSIGGFV